MAAAVAKKKDTISRVFLLTAYSDTGEPRLMELSHMVWSGCVFSPVVRITAANRDSALPYTNGAKGPIPSQSKPAMTLAGSSAIPARVEWSPSIVPFN